MIGLKEEKRALFGGALRCAGLAAAAMTASAMGDFVPSAPAYPPPLGLNLTTNYAAFAGGGYHLAYNYTADASFPAPTSYASAGGSLFSSAGSSLMEATSSLADSGLWNYAYAGVVQYFTVDSVKDVLLEWDFTNGYDAAGEFGRAWVYEFGGGFLAQEISGVGSLGLTLTPGSEYFFVGRAGTIGGDAFARLSNVPAPGVLSLMGIGLMAARRRRRRE